VVSFAALLLFAAFLYYQLKVLQNGSNVIGAAEQIVKISLKGNGQQTLGAAPSIHWLGPFLSSTPELDVPSRPSAQVLEQVLAQQRQCPNNCSNVGNCLGDLGICQCPGGGCNPGGRLKQEGEAYTLPHTKPGGVLHVRCAQQVRHVCVVVVVVSQAHATAAPHPHQVLCNSRPHS
jgi:hypothetical protein